MIQSIVHIALVIEDYDEAIDFYTNKLHFTLILGGAIVGIEAFTANRFQISEWIFITLGGMIAGIGFGLVCYTIIRLLKK